MSEHTSYISEPATKGKVVVVTTMVRPRSSNVPASRFCAQGEIDVELWPEQAPKTVRNFVQLCLEGYYNGNIFHRIIKGPLPFSLVLRLTTASLSPVACACAQA